MVLPAATHYETEGVYVVDERARPAAAARRRAARGRRPRLGAADRAAAPPRRAAAPTAPPRGAFARGRRRAAGAGRARLRRASATWAPTSPRRARPSPNGRHGPARAGRRRACRWWPRARIFGDADAVPLRRRLAARAHRRRAGAQPGRGRPPRAGRRRPGARCARPTARRTLPRADRRRPPRGRRLRRAGRPGAGVERLLPADRGPVRVEIGGSALMDETFLVILIKAVVVVFVLITAFAYTLLWERKLIGRFQARYGPNRAGPVGYLQPLADVVKLIFKEDFVPQGANRLLFQIAPMISVFAAVAAVAVIPFGGSIELFGPHGRPGRAPT